MAVSNPFIWRSVWCLACCAVCICGSSLMRCAGLDSLMLGFIVSTVGLGQILIGALPDVSATGKQDKSL